MDDMGFGIVTSVIANVNRNEKKQKKPFVPEDFMPTYGAPKKKTGKDLKQFWDTFVRPHNAAVEKARKQRHGR